MKFKVKAVLKAFIEANSIQEALQIHAKELKKLDGSKVKWDIIKGKISVHII